MAAIDDLSNLLTLLSNPVASKKLLGELKEHQTAKAAAEHAVSQVKIEKASLNDMQAKIDRNHVELVKKQDEHAREVAKHQGEVAAHSSAKASFAAEKNAMEVKAKEVAAREGSFKEWEGRLKSLEAALAVKEADLTKRLNILKQAVA